MVNFLKLSSMTLGVAAVISSVGYGIYKQSNQPRNIEELIKSKGDKLISDFPKEEQDSKYEKKLEEIKKDSVRENNKSKMKDIDDKEKLKKWCMEKIKLPINTQVDLVDSVSKYCVD